MYERTAVGWTLTEAYHNALKKLDEVLVLYGASPCPDWNCKQAECAMTMIVRYPLDEPRISRLIPCGQRELQKYCMEITDGIMDFEVEKGNWAYTYHDRMTNFPAGHMIDWECHEKYEFGVNQLAFVVEELKRNPHSRRAVITIRSARDIDVNAEPACLQHIQFFIRNGRLDMMVMFRSNDAVKATFMNAFALIKLQEEVAFELGVPVGTYTHRANSFHVYERDFELLHSYVKRINNIHAPTTYEYFDDWEEDMESYIPDILREVEELTRR